jgi:hypothetical protein
MGRPRIALQPIPAAFEEHEMNQQAAKIEVTVEDVKDAAPSTAGGESSVVIETESTIDGQRHDTSIEVRDADAPAVAVALLNAEVSEPPNPEALPAAVRCLAAGVMPAASAGQLRLHLQFDSGQVLPIEMPLAAAQALARALDRQLVPR